MYKRLTTEVGTAKTLAVPLVHLNGTSKEALLEQVQRASAALASALVLMHDAEPHGRDYYPMGTDAYAIARDEHVARINRLVDVRNELMAIAEAIDDQHGQGRLPG